MAELLTFKKRWGAYGIGAQVSTSRLQERTIGHLKEIGVVDSSEVDDNPVEDPWKPDAPAALPKKATTKALTEAKPKAD